MGSVEVPVEFAALFSRVYPRARTVAHRILGYPAKPRTRPPRSSPGRWSAGGGISDLPYLDAWVLRVTANVAVDAVRRRRAVPVAQVADTAAAAGPDDLAVLRMALVAALAALPRRQREVIALRFLVGLHEDEIARCLGVSIGSVKRHNHRGMAVLRNRLGGDWDPSRTEGVAGVA